MLSLFKEQKIPLNGAFALGRARELFISSLNKGVIPEWEEFLGSLPVLDQSEDLALIKNLFEKLTAWDFLKTILSQHGTEYFFHSPDHCQVLNLNGGKEDFKIDLALSDWQLWLEIISIHFKQNWNVQNPFASFYGELFGRSFRFSLIHGSTSPKGISKLVLRTLAPKAHALSSFGNTETLSDFVAQKKNILIAGSTGSGKTSLLNSLLSDIPNHEHLVILEDTYEILTERDIETRFLAGSTTETSLKSYLAYSLRLSPDRIILGEMRSHEVVPFLMAMNTGHKGLMGTIHSSSSVDALNRIALLFSLYGGETNIAYEKVMELICRNLEVVVFMENKKVKEVIRVLGCDQGVPFFENVV